MKGPSLVQNGTSGSEFLTVNSWNYKRYILVFYFEVVFIVYFI